MLNAGSAPHVVISRHVSTQRGFYAQSRRGRAVRS